MNYRIIFRHNRIKKRPSQPTRPNKDGQSLVEFALILGLMLVFLFGSIEITNLLQQKTDLDNLVKQAAKQAGEFGGGREEVEAYIRKQMEYLNYDTAAIDAAIATLTLQSQEFNGTTFTPSSNGEECTYGEFITVSMTVQGQVDIPAFLFFDEFVRNAIQLQVQNNARCWRS